MKAQIILMNGMSVTAEATSIKELCEALNGSTWLSAGNGVVKISSIAAIVPIEEKPAIAEVPSAAEDPET